MARFAEQAYAFASGSASRFAMIDDGEDLVPDVRGSLSPAQMVDAKLYALVGADTSGHREESGSLHDRRLLKNLNA